MGTGEENVFIVSLHKIFQKKIPKNFKIKISDLRYQNKNMGNKKDSVWETIKGTIAGILIFSAIVGFNVFMFWLCMQIFGWKI